MCASKIGQVNDSLVKEILNTSIVQDVYVRVGQVTDSLVKEGLNTSTVQHTIDKVNPNIFMLFYFALSHNVSQLVRLSARKEIIV